jgi:nitrogen fixation protein NifB
MKLERPPLQTRVVDWHPCFDKSAACRFGRIHLPVAPACNIQCNYCDRKYDCASENRPGVTSRVITPQEAVSRVAEVLPEIPAISVVGIAGPGDPLFNEATFETFRLLGAEFPALHKCLSTNGLLLPEKLGLLRELDVETITVTVNAVEPSVAAGIYSHVYYRGRKMVGDEAARVLLGNQLAGIEMAVNAGIAVKVNTVMIPTVNDTHIIEVARKTKELGVYVQNIIPLMPLSRFAHLTAPSPADVQSLRADAIGLLHNDKSQHLFA